MFKTVRFFSAVSVMLTCIACSHQPDRTENTTRQLSATTLGIEPLSSANATAPSASKSASTSTNLAGIQQAYPAGDLCTMLATCKTTTADTAASTATQTPQTAEDTTRTGGAGTHNQTSIYPDMNVDLVQLPGEASIQYVNGIYTSLVKDKQHADLSQKTEFKNVRFNQIRAPSSMNTINMVVTDDKSVSGNLDQSFKFKSIEMTQRDSAGSVHAMNYLGDSTR